MDKPLFSQRMGYRPLKKLFQRESLDQELRNRIWNLFVESVSDPGTRELPFRTSETEGFARFLKTFWTDFLKKPLPTALLDESYREIRELLLGHIPWYEIYDFLEFLFLNFPYPKEKNNFQNECNRILESENAAYRIIGDQVVEITEKGEITTIEEALAKSSDPVKLHLQKALKHFGDRQKPDYSNSIKEAILAVEALCKEISGNPNATLGDVLKKLNIHPALKEGFSKLYGYTSDAGGIRHGLKDGDMPPTWAEAKFMLVACSAFINYLRIKTVEVRNQRKTQR